MHLTNFGSPTSRKSARMGVSCVGQSRSICFPGGLLVGRYRPLLHRSAAASPADGLFGVASQRRWLCATQTKCLASNGTPALHVDADIFNLTHMSTPTYELIDRTGAKLDSV